MLKLSRQEIIFLLILCVTSFLISIPLFTQSIRLDEAQSIWISIKPTPALMKTVSEDVHVPLYELILHIWMQIFGTDILTVRIISFIFFGLSLPIIYVLFKESKDIKVASIGVMFFALSPFVLWYATEARMYSMLIFASSLSNLYFLRFLKSNSQEGKLGYFLSTLLGLYTHYFFLFLIFSQMIFLLTKLFLISFRGSNFKQTFRFIFSQPTFKIVSLSIFIGIVLFLPWIFYVFKSGLAANTQPLIPKPSTFNIFQTLMLFIFGFQTNIAQAVLVSLWPLTAVCLFLIFDKKHKNYLEHGEYFLISLILPIITTFLISFIHPIFLSRYLIFVSPMLFFLIALVLSDYIGNFAKIFIPMFMITVFLFATNQDISAANPVRENYSGVTRFLNIYASYSDIIAVTAPFTVYPIEYDYHGMARIDTIPSWNRFTNGPIPPFSKNKLVSQVDGYQQNYNHLFVIFSYDQGYENKIQTYLDDHYKLLYSKTFSYGLSVREYQLRYG